jgi:hypothetical protein
LFKDAFLSCQDATLPYEQVLKGGLIAGHGRKDHFLINLY